MAPLSRSSALAGLTAAVLLAAGCGGGTGGGEGGEPIKIGVPVPLSGDYASAGEDILRGARLAAQDINQRGGVLGRKIQIAQADDACGAQVGAQAAQRLVSSGIAAAAGGYCSTAALPELNTFHRSKIPFVMDASTNPQLTEMGFAEAFRTIGRDDQQGPIAASFIVNDLKAGRAAVLHDNTTYAKGLADAAAKALQQEGAQVVYNDALTPGQADYTPVLTKISGAKPDVLYFTGYFAEAGLLIKQAKQLGADFQMVGGDATNDPTLIKTAGPAAEGFMLSTAPLAQFLPAAQDYVKSYQQAHGAQPGPYSVYEYDAVSVVAEAIEKAGSAEPEKITQALAGIKGFQGLTGTITFDENGDRSDPVYIIARVEDGKFAGYKDLKDGQWVDFG
ncbi:MAG: ABC transporter substrate-binding protein [Streptosporangiales bacterium]|nr:ABC transporter substrate-binding protein [Streptosporangiales bacterium]